MRLSELEENTLTDSLIDRLLFEGLDYGGQNADLILVPGSRKAWLYRVPLAAELYRSGMAGKLLFSGGGVHELFGERVTEYSSMLTAARVLDLPENDILIEKNAANTAENMRLSREIIARELPSCGKIILVTAAFHMRRALLFAERLMPEYEFIPAPANKGTTLESWKYSEKQRRTALDECMKLKEYAAKGMIEDMEIQL